MAVTEVSTATTKVWTDKDKNLLVVERVFDAARACVEGVHGGRPHREVVGAAPVEHDEQEDGRARGRRVALLHDGP